MTVSTSASAASAHRRPPAYAADHHERPDVAAVYVHCTDLELAGTEVSLSIPRRATSVRLLVRLHGVPLGFLTVCPDRCGDLITVRHDAAREFADAARTHLAADGLTASGLTVDEPGDPARLVERARDAVPCPARRLGTGVPVSVVVATRNRPEHVRHCLRHLRAQDHASFDVVVVDNAPDDDATRDVFAELVGDDPRFAYVRLDRAGVSRARNAGLDRATGSVVAFIDDDVRVDRHWLTAVSSAFAGHADVVCVTGLVASDTIAGSEQLYFDSRVSWADSLEPHLFHPTSDDPLHPWAAGRFGAGANMAFRTDAIRALGGFDEDLGPGTVAKGGEDIDLFVRALQAGGDLLYEPSALVWHVHRSDPGDLERQMFGYGVGLTAYLAKQALHPQRALEMARRLPRATRHILGVTKAPQRSRDAVPAARRYRRIELTGMALGPLYYLHSRLRAWARGRRPERPVTRP